MPFGRRSDPDPWSPRERVHRQVQASTARGGRIALAMGVLAISTLLVVAFYSAYQVSDRARTMVLIEQGVASVTDVDNYLHESLPAVRSKAGSSDQEFFSLPGYPIDIRLEAGELRTASNAEIRDLVLRRSAAAVYDEGLAAFSADDGESLGILTEERATDTALSLLRGSTHERAATMTVLCALLAALCASIVAASDFRPGVLRAIGGAMLAGALTGLGLAALAMLIVDSLAGDDVFSREIARIAGSVFEVPRRNYLVASVLSAILFGAGWALTILESRTRNAAAYANDGTAGWSESAPLPAYADDTSEDMLIGS